MPTVYPHKRIIVSVEHFTVGDGDMDALAQQAIRAWLAEGGTTNFNYRHDNGTQILVTPDDFEGDVPEATYGPVENYCHFTDHSDGDRIEYSPPADGSPCPHCQQRIGDIRALKHMIQPRMLPAPIEVPAGAETIEVLSYTAKYRLDGQVYTIGK